LRGLFIAGTDTGVGKTFVACALLRALRQRGVSCVGLKPFETGCDPRARDAEALEREARSGLPLDDRCPFRYRLPLAPAAAAEREGRTERGVFARALRTIERAARGEFAVIEAAGGLLVPITRTKTMLDLAAALGLPVVLVGRNALGTQNQTALSMLALRRRKLVVRAIVISRGRLPADPSQADNARWVAHATGFAPVFELPRTTLANAAEVVSACLRL
jgi:dethiobiotin synthetase